VVTKADGSVKARYDYLPFGEEIPSTVGNRSSLLGYSAADSTRQKFTQKERDGESGLDYFGARYYSSPQGRFTSVDPLLESARRKDPQTWNRYAYARNNPLRFIDPTGEEDEDTDESQQIVKRTIKRKYEFKFVDQRGDKNTTFNISVTEETVQYIDAATGAVGIQEPTTATVDVTAVTIGEISKDQERTIQGDIETIRGVVKDIVEVSANKGVNPVAGLSIAAEETALGTTTAILPANQGRLEKLPVNNPMQLSASSGYQPTTDRRANISGAIDLFNGFSRGGIRSFAETLAGYGRGYPAGQRLIQQYANDIGAQYQKTFKQTYQDTALRRGFQ
jgi:RHS repeat-associated protein